MKIDLELKQRRLLACENQPELAKELHFFTAEEDVREPDILAWVMTGEDPLAFFEQSPCVMFWLGIDTLMPCHHPKMSLK